MKQSEYTISFVTIDKREPALKIARELVQRKLAACVNILPQIITSVYEWKGEICETTELMLVIKSRRTLFDEMESAITALHPYDVPEIVSFPIVAGHQPYLEWLAKNTAYEES